MRMTGPVALMLACALGVPRAGTWQPELRTPAERSGFERTSRYAEVVAVLDAVAAASPDLVTLTTFGRSEEGRDLPLAVLGAPAPREAASARAAARPRVLVVANIHAGEVDGKEAALILARRLTRGDLRPLLDRITVLLVPIYNADGNERISLENRPAQFGPLGGVGIRANARGLDLNRDFMKLDSAEARALAALLAAWDPHVVVDLHTTNGSYHGYHLTYAPSLAVNASARLVEMSRALLSTSGQVLADRGWRTYNYGNFVAEGALDRERQRPDEGAPAWRTFDARPRFLTNGVGLRNRIAILSESYSYLSFERRVRVTEAFVETLLALVARRAGAITALAEELDRETAAAGRQGRLGALGTRGVLTPLEGAVRVLVGDVETRPHPVTGAPMTAMKEAVARPMLMQEYASFAPAGVVPAPRAYLVPADVGRGALVTRVSELLTRHGIAFESIGASQEVLVERVVPAAVRLDDRVVQGRRQQSLSGVARDRATVVLPAGSLRVGMDQPLARLVFHLLEPTSDDGVVSWGLAGEWVRAGEPVPIYRQPH